MRTINRRELIRCLGAFGVAGAAASRAWPAATSNLTFTDIARASGITFQHDNAASPKKYLIETMGSGCGWIDYNQDGLLDLYFVQSAATD